MRIRIFKSRRLLLALQDEREIFRAPAALGKKPCGAKRCEGDGKTPEGVYWICLVKEHGRYGRGLGLSYPGPEDAKWALVQQTIDEHTCERILSAHQEGRRPPWGTPLGGEIYLHGGGAKEDWTQGCIALEDEDMERVFEMRDLIREVEILP